MHKAISVLPLIVTCCARTAAGADMGIDFARDVAPIFEKHCLLCHQAGRSEGDLSLATKEGLQENEFVVAGDPDASHLISVVTGSEGERPEMPNTGAPLTKKQIAVLRRWISDGATWPDDLVLPQLWSLASIESLETTADEISNPDTAYSIDHFVRQRLQEHELQPNPIATRRDLIRRLKYDLLGLPPTPAEIDAFVNDQRPDAWQRLIDRFLDSPHYGERWAQHWLDVVRFSESHGFEDDKPRPDAWPYRDYVIRSLNDDKPYDEFIREQIAGDVMEPVTRDGIIATSMLVNGPFDHAAGVSASKTEKLRAREVMLEELVTTVGQSILGLTVNCARCHDHKFDPIPQADYYRIKAVFEGVYQADGTAFDARPVLTAQETEQWKQHRERLAERKAALADLHRWRSEITDDENLPPLNRATALWQFDGTGPEELQREVDRKGGQSSIEAKWTARFGIPAASPINAANSDQKTLDTGTGHITKNETNGAGYAIIPTLDGSELLPTGSMSIFARVRYTGSFNGTDDVFRIGDTGNKNRDSCGFELVADGDSMQNAQARFVVTGQNKQQEIGVTLPHKLQLNTWYDLVGVFESVAPAKGRMTISVASPDSGEPIAPALSQDVDFESLTSTGRQNLLFFVAPSFENGPQPNAQMDLAAVWHNALGDEEIRSLSALEAKRSAENQSSSRSVARLQELDLQIKNVEHEIASLTKQIDSAPRALIGLRKQPLPTVIYTRGNIRSPGGPVHPAGLSAIKQLPAEFAETARANEGERRRQFADWITDPRNPLFARVIVNRLWHHHFGSGIVDTPSDFGINGGRPSHPELLDWLAARFVADDYSLKRTHRRILMSETWRQTSGFNEEAAKVDADNRLLWRFNPRRLDAETIRDAMLFTSGELNPLLGGPSFQPFTTTFFNTTFYHLFDKGTPEFNRRTIYRMHVNTGRDPLLDSLDCPAPSVLAPRRRQTITPLQALGLMNDTFVLRQCNKLAERIKNSSTSQDEQIREAWQRMLGRSPSVHEFARANAVISRADMQTLCWVLFNSSEFLQVR